MAVVSASRRTDIPAFYSDWFLNRLGKEVVTINPFNSGQANSMLLTEEDVDCFVFWTKDPSPMLERLNELDGYNFYFQYTLNGYGRKIEPNVPERDRSIRTFIALSERIGKEKVIWRYDPVLLNGEFTAEWHIGNFEYIAERLHPYTERCVFSFIDMYPKIRKNLSGTGIREPNEKEMRRIAEGFSETAGRYGIRLFTCCEGIELGEYGIGHSSCIDADLMERLFGIRADRTKDAQREGCGCVRCHDIGAYNTCRHGCIYCYATYDTDAAEINGRRNDIDSPVLIGELGSDVRVYPVRDMKRKGVLRPLSDFCKDG